MNENNKINLIKLYKQKSKNFEIIRPNNLNLKKSSLKTFNNIDTPNQNELSQENHKILFFENNDKFNTLILPSIINTSTHSKSLLNSSLINNSNIESPLNEGNKNHIIKLKKLKVKKIKDKKAAEANKKLLNIYKEDYQLKKKFEKYKLKKAEDMKNFSYQKYNNNLLKLSSINISQNSYNIFKKNMETIELHMKGQKMKRKNRWLIFLDKIGNFAPETLKNRIKSLSEHKKLEELKD